MTNVVIVDAVRTPIGRRGGGLASMHPAELLGIVQKALIDRTGIDRSTLADIIRRMLKKGLILRRRTKEDARAYAVRLSEEGWKTLKSAEPLAARMRPRTLDELVGQEHVAKALSNAISTRRVGHAYLFTGARGVGKTSVAAATVCTLEDTCSAVADDDVTNG